MADKKTRHRDAWSVNVEYESSLHVSERNPSGYGIRLVLVAASSEANAIKRAERAIHEMEDERGDRGRAKILSSSVSSFHKDGMVPSPDAVLEIGGKQFTIAQPGMDNETADGKPWVLEGD